jgi:CubicO group peptidase (beta-lactamase class C family)
LELDAPVNRYLPGWKIVNPLGGREVTVRDLLTHRSGLATNDAHSVFTAPKPLAEHIRESYSRTHFKPYRSSVPMWSAKPGEKYTYSNLGIATLGYLVEVTNPERLSFSVYVQKHIMDPLGMRSSQYPAVQDSLHVRPDIWARLSTGYTGFGAIRFPTPPIYFGDYPAGAVVTTPGDHIRLLLAYLNEGTLDGYRLLRPETVREMLTPQHPLGADVSVGLVWNLRERGKPTYNFGHGGAHMWGWTNTFLAFPELDVALAIFMNQWSLPDDAATRYREATFIIDFVKSWLQRERAGQLVEVAPRSWAWKVSYVAGLTLVERTNGALGIDERLTPATIDAIVRGAGIQRDLERGEPLWDPDGFRAGIADMGGVELRLPTIAEFMRSSRLKVLPEEVPLLYLELGGRYVVPNPQ